MSQDIGATILEMERDYTSGSVTISDYVEWNMYETINTIEAYLNSKHISGSKDSQGREKPFFNIVVSASNIWFRATDIDRKNIRIRAKDSKSVVPAFIATVFIQDWMRKAKFGQYLNEQGRVLSRYGSALTQCVEKDGELHVSVQPWNKTIVDPIEIKGNPIIKVLELTPAQLKRKHGYDQEIVDKLCNSLTTRKTLKKLNKDNSSKFIRIYEIHGEFPEYCLTDDEKDYDKYSQQVHVVAFTASKDDKNSKEQNTLYKGREDNPFSVCHLIKEDGRAIAIGAVEHLFESQWMENHTALSIKNQLDVASKLIFQTSDPSFLNQNVISAVESGDVLVHKVNEPLTQANNSSHDISSLQSFAQTWKALGNEIVGISEAMLGVAPKSGTAWRQTEALLQESYSLFELMTENRGLYLEELFTDKIIPFIKKKMLRNSKELAATLEDNDINWIDTRYIKNFSVKATNDIVKEKLLKGENVSPQQQQEIMAGVQESLKNNLEQMGSTRFIKPSEISSKQWKDILEDLEWNVEIEITGENKDYQAALSTLNTALQVVMNPAYESNPKAKMIVAEILKTAGTLSPLQLSSIKTPSAVPPNAQVGAQSGGSNAELNIK